MKELVTHLANHDEIDGDFDYDYDDDDDGNCFSSLEVANSLAFFHAVQWLAANRLVPLISFSITSLVYCITFLLLSTQRSFNLEVLELDILY